MKRFFRNISKTGKISFPGMLLSLFILTYVNGQNVGITDASSITPNYLLQLHKNTSGATSFLQFTNTLGGIGTTATDGFTFDVDASFNLSLNNREATSLGFSTSGTTRMTILSGGNVGIGDVSPASLFTVGNGDLFQILSTGEARGITGTAASPSFSFTGNTSTGLYCSAANEISFSTAGTQRMTILSGGGLQINSVSGSATVNPSNNSLITADNSGIIGKYMANLPPSGTLELWYRPTGQPYISPYSNANIRVYDVTSQPYGIFYDGGTNTVGGYFRTTSSVPGTTAVQGFSDVSGQQQYGYLGYNGPVTIGGSTVNGASVYGFTNDPLSIGVYAQTTGNASVAASVSYSDKWIASYNYVDNARVDYNPSSVYGQLNVSAVPSGTWRQPAIQGYGQYLAGSGNVGWTVGVEGDALGNTQDAIGVMGIAQNTNAVNGVNIGVEGAASGGLINLGLYSDCAIGTSEYTMGPLAAGNYIIGIGDASFLRISATAAFGISAFSATGGTTISGYDGRILIVYVPSGYAVTFYNENVAVPTAGQRILTGTGGNVTTTAGGGCRATFIYSYTDSRWIMISLIN